MFFVCFAIEDNNKKIYFILLMQKKIDKQFIYINVSENSWTWHFD